jgi:alanyl-tRNA synthetase
MKLIASNLTKSFKGRKVVGKLENRNVDTGAGFERMVAVVQGKNSVYDTDIFTNILEQVKVLTDEQKNQRIIADHFRTAVFMISDGITPSNTDRGYILRRLLRRAVVKTQNRKINSGEILAITGVIANLYESGYPEIKNKIESIRQEIEKEVEKFEKTLEEGLKQFNWLARTYINKTLVSQELPPLIVFELVTTYGFPYEIVEEIAREKGLSINKMLFDNRMDEHKIKSRAGSEQKFKGGLGSTGEMETKYHTTTHLLHQALRDILGDSVQQRGSNITAERLRFDFAFERKMTDDEKKRVEETVNEKIKLSLPVKKEVMKKSDAEKTGALHFFGEKYPDEVNVYYIGDSLDSAYSKEFCGGPHVENTNVLGKFKIVKEEAVSAGVRRIKAILE